MAVDLSIVVAVYNEDPRNLDLLLERLSNSIEPTSLKYEVVFVNDGSRVPTTEALYNLVYEHDNIKLLVLSRNFGQQAAISAGFDHSEGDAVVNLDSDGQDPPELIPQMVKLWKEGYDVVYAQRSARRDKFAKRFSAFIFYRVLGALSTVQIPWDTGDFRLIDRKVLDALSLMPEKSRFLRGQIPWLGFRQIGIPIARGAREIGESTYTIRKLLALAMDGLLGFSIAPLYMVPTMGGILLAASVLFLLGLVACAMMHQAVADAAWLGGAMGVFSGLQLIGIGVVAIYISKVIEEIRARPTYVVAEKLGLPFARNDQPNARTTNSATATLVERSR
jgi:polyisoprenyl-phosphate glycosyltransferase